MSEKIKGDAPSLRESLPLQVNDLPAPRLQLRWSPYEPQNGDNAAFGFNWACYYELVLPLGEYDQRREIYEDGEFVGERQELVLPFPGFTRTGRSRAPCADDSGLVSETPFRDGAHAQWDSVALGGLPIFVIAPDGTALPVARKDGSSPQIPEANQ